MAGIDRLCGRFCCARQPMTHNGAQSAKFSHLRRLWRIVPRDWQGGGVQRVSRTCARMIRGAWQVFKGV